MQVEVKKLESKISIELQDKYWKKFEKQAVFLGNGVYEWANIYETDTRLLFLKGIAAIEGIKI